MTSTAPGISNRWTTSSVARSSRCESRRPGESSTEGGYLRGRSPCKSYTLMISYAADSPDRGVPRESDWRTTPSFACQTLWDRSPRGPIVPYIPYRILLSVRQSPCDRNLLHISEMRGMAATSVSSLPDNAPYARGFPATDGMAYTPPTRTEMRPRPNQAWRGNLVKSGGRFSTKESRPSWASGVW